MVKHNCVILLEAKTRKLEEIIIIWYVLETQVIERAIDDFDRQLKDNRQDKGKGPEYEKWQSRCNVYPQWVDNSMDKAIVLVSIDPGENCSTGM
jgi:hypothetical protein